MGPPKASRHLPAPDWSDAWPVPRGQRLKRRFGTPLRHQHLPALVPTTAAAPRGGGDGMMAAGQRNMAPSELSGAALPGRLGCPALDLTGSSFRGRSLRLRRAARTRPIRSTARLVEAVIEKPVFSETARESQTQRLIANTVSAVILGGGAGSRLYPLTKSRAKPAVSIGGAYRLVDIPISNCINSGINKIYVLTQYNSTSLNRHVGRTYNRGITYTGKRNMGYVEVLAASLAPGQGHAWFQGTADAVRRYTWILDDVRNRKMQHIVILSGDHLYRMDYMSFVMEHVNKNADITIAAIPCGVDRASDFGLMKVDDMARVVDFAEKPKGSALEAMKVDTAILGLDPQRAEEMPFIASMGVYVFKKDVLLDLLNNKFQNANDFGNEIIPGAKEAGYYLNAYLFDGYWEDIGTISSFFDANLALTADSPAFEFYDPESPIYTSPRGLQPTKIDDCKITEALISHGCSIQQSTIHHSVIGLRNVIGRGCIIKDAMIMGADFYEGEQERQAKLAEGGVPLGIGDNTVICNAIVDKNARVGKNCKIINKEGVDEKQCEDEGYIIRSGIVVILSRAVIPDGTEI
eukprot:evm.model.scf_134.3 EVM.evm.TU.scf_134.3   scf_134:59843-64984(+)